MKRSGFLLIAVLLFSGGLFYLRAASDTAVHQATPVPAVPETIQQTVTDTPAVNTRQPVAAAVVNSSDTLPSSETLPEAATQPPSPPAPALEPEIREALKGMLNTSSEGLVVEEHNGAKTINLQGRFRTAPVATINERGEAQITDYSWLPAE